MKFIVIKTSDDKFRKEIEIKDLNQLMKFVTIVGDSIIIPETSVLNEGKIPMIEIYDDYREWLI